MKKWKIALISKNSFTSNIFPTRFWLFLSEIVKIFVCGAVILSFIVTVYFTKNITQYEHLKCYFKKYYIYLLYQKIRLNNIVECLHHFQTLNTSTLRMFEPQFRNPISIFVVTKKTRTPFLFLYVIRRNKYFTE